MRYKIYEIKKNNESLVFIEADFNYGCGCDSIDKAQEMIERNGVAYINYTILPYINLYERGGSQEREELNTGIGRFSSLDECENEAISFTENKLKTVNRLLSVDYKIGYMEGIEHYLASKNNLHPQK